MTRAVLSALLSQWRRAPLQLFTLLAGLALATALWSGVQAINAEARASYDAAAATLGEARYDQLLADDRRPIPQETYVALRRAGWLVSPVVEGRLDGLRIVGLDPLTAPGGLGPVQVEGGDIGPFLSGAGQVYATSATLDRLTAPGPERVVAPDVAPDTVLTDIGVAQRLLGMEGQVSRLLLAPAQPIGRPALDEVAPGLTLRPAQGGTDVGRLTDSFHLNLTAFGLLSFAVGIFIVNGAVGLAFEARRPVVRTLRALGVPLRRIVAVILAELAVLALVAGLIGVALGGLIAAALLPDVAASLRGLYGAEVAGQLSLRPEWWLSGLAVAVGGTALAAFGAVRRLILLPPLAAGQPRAWAMQAGRSRMWQAGVGGLLIAVAGVLALWGGGGLPAGFALLGALLVGAALLLPGVLAAALRLGARMASGPTAQWFWADTRQQLPGLSLALMALLLAMAANVGVATMVSSFRLTFTGFLDQRLAAELYIAAEDSAQADAALQVADARADEILPLMSVERELAGLPGEVFAARDARTYRENWTFLQAVPQVWDRLARQEGALVNEQLARRAGLSLGDPVEVADRRQLPILGIFGDYGNPIGQAIVTEDLFRDAYPEIVPLRFGLRLAPTEVAETRAALVAAGLNEADLIDQAGIKAFSLSIFDRTFAVTAALNVLTLAVAGFAMLMSLLTLAGQRLPQLAPVWALGLRRATLGRAELLRMLVLAGLTALVALPLGLALAWALLAVVNVAAFGWKLPMFLFWGDYARLGLLALVAAALAAALPAWRLWRLPPARLLKVFADAR